MATKKSVSKSEATRKEEAAENPRKFMIVGKNQLLTKTQMEQQISNSKATYGNGNHVIVEAIGVIKAKSEEIPNLPTIEI